MTSTPASPVHPLRAWTLTVPAAAALCTIALLPVHAIGFGTRVSLWLIAAVVGLATGGRRAWVGRTVGALIASAPVVVIGWFAVIFMTQPVAF